MGKVGRTSRMEEVVEVVMVAGDGGGRSVTAPIRRTRPWSASAITAVLCFWFAVGGVVAAQNSNASHLHLLARSDSGLDTGNASQPGDDSGHQRGLEQPKPSEGRVLTAEEAGEPSPNVPSAFGPPPNRDEEQPKWPPSHADPRVFRERSVHVRTRKSMQAAESTRSVFLLSGMSRHRRLDIEEAIGGGGGNHGDVGHLHGRRTRRARESDTFTELETNLPKNVRNHDVDGLFEQGHRPRSHHQHHPGIETRSGGVSASKESREGHWRDSPGERRGGASKKIRHRRKKPSSQTKHRPGIGTTQIEDSSSPEGTHDTGAMLRPLIGHSPRYIPLRRERNPRLEGNAQHLLAELVENHRGRPELRLGHQRMAAETVRPEEPESQQGPFDTRKRQDHEGKAIGWVGSPAEDGGDTLGSLSGETLSVDSLTDREMYPDPARFTPIYRTSDGPPSRTNEDHRASSVPATATPPPTPSTSSVNINNNDNKSGSEERPSHYTRVDPRSGLQVPCEKCPAGERVLSHCTAGEPRVCAACKPGTFAERWNAATGCRRCGPPCSESGLEERAPCTAIKDRVCACPAGWYAGGGGDDGAEAEAVGRGRLRCAPHTKCLPGWGVRRKGTKTRDVSCKQCSRGTFSTEESSTARCRPHANCTLLGLPLVSAGDGRHDSVCGHGNGGSASAEEAAADARSERSPVTTTPAGAALPGGAEEEAGVELAAPATPRSSGEHHLQPLPLPAGADSGYAPSPSGIRPQAGDSHQQDLVNSPLAPESRGGAVRQTDPETNVAASGTPITPAANIFGARSESGGNATASPDRPARPSLDAAGRRGEPAAPSGGPPRRRPPLSGASAANIPPAVGRIPTRSSSGRALAKPPQPPPAPFDINEHVAWLVVVFILLLLVVAVACSVYRSSRALRKGPGEPPETIRQRALPPQLQQQQLQQQQQPQLPHQHLQKQSHQPPPHHNHHHHRARGQSRTQLNLQIAEPASKWVFSYQGQRVDILRLVAGHIGCQWKELYRALLASAASSSSCGAAAAAAAATDDPTVLVDESAHASYQEAAYAALLGWTAVDAEANLARLIGALRTCGWNSLVERIRAIMEDSTLTERDEVGPLPVVLCAGRGTRGSLAPGVEAGALSGAVVVGAGGECRLGLHTPAGGACKPGRTAPFQDEAEPLLRCDSTSSGSSTGSAKAWSFIAKEKRDTILRQVLADSLQLQPIFDDVFSLLSVEELRAVEACGQPDEKLERIFDVLGCKSREASQRLLDSLYEHLPELL